MTLDAARAAMIAKLDSMGVLDPAWRDAFDQVPRHAFIPDTIWRVDRGAGNRLAPLHRADNPDAWLSAAYRDRPVDTQVDDGHPAADGTGWEVTSSASQPSVVAEMLHALNVQPGMRVLEIGAGTGWNAALLAHRVGAENVVTIDIDEHVTASARAALDNAGYGKVTVITGDGAAGWADGAPYDRVIATVGVTAVPLAWVTQSTVGGRLVVPLNNTFQAPGLAILDVTEHGEALGRLGGPAQFMGLRAERVPRPRGADFGSPAESTTSTDLHPYRWAGDRAAATAVGQLVAAGLHTLYEPHTDNTGTQWLYAPDSRSWASIEVTCDGPPYRVEQAGPRCPFDEVAAAYQHWLDVGSPALDAWKVRVGPAGQTIYFTADAPKTPRST